MPLPAKYEVLANEETNQPMLTMAGSERCNTPRDGARTGAWEDEDQFLYEIRSRENDHTVKPSYRKGRNEILEQTCCSSCVITLMKLLEIFGTLLSP